MRYIVYKQIPIEKHTKGFILPFPKKVHLRITKNYRGITLPAIAAQVHNVLLLNCTRPKVKKTLTKNQNGSRRNRSKTSQFLTKHRYH